MTARTRILYSHVDGHKVAEYHDGECVFMDEAYFGVTNEGPMVIGDIPAYQSPIDGHWVESRAQRREDLKRNGCRPYEGLEQEKKEAARIQQYQTQQMDARLERSAGEVLAAFKNDSRWNVLRKVARG